MSGVRSSRRVVPWAAKDQHSGGRGRPRGVFCCWFVRNKDIKELSKTGCIDFQDPIFEDANSKNIPKTW